MWHECGMRDAYGTLTKRLTGEKNLKTEKQIAD